MDATLTGNAEALFHEPALALGETVVTALGLRTARISSTLKGTRRKEIQERKKKDHKSDTVDSQTRGPPHGHTHK